LVEGGFVAEEEQAFGVGIEAANGIEVSGKAEVGQSAVGGAIGREAGEDTARFVEGEEHGPEVG
jgi:hypothetical protein